MYNSGCEQDLCKDRNTSFRKAVRVPKKNQGYLLTNRNDLDLCNPGCSLRDTTHSSINPEVEYSDKAAGKTKYNWKQFLPWAPRTKG